MEALERSGNEEEMKNVLTNNTFQVNQVDTDVGNTLLHLAAKRKNAKIVDFLLNKQRANPRIQNQYGILPIHVAIDEDSVDVLQIFTDYDEDLLKVKILDESDGNVKIIDDSNVNVSPETDDNNKSKGMSLLHYAIPRVSMNSIRFLVEQNPDCVNDICNFQQMRGASVIHMAFIPLKIDDPSEAEKLKDKMPNNKKSKWKSAGGEEPEAAPPRQLKAVTAMIKLFLEHSSKDILITDGSGSVLFKLILMKNLEAIKTIYNSRFKNEKEFLKRLSNFKSKKGQTPIEEAVRMPNDPSQAAELFKLLLDNGADVSAAVEAVSDVSDIKLFKFFLDNCEESQRALLVTINISINIFRLHFVLHEKFTLF